MKFDGSFSLDAPINKVYTTLIDPKIMAKGLPDLEDLEIIDADHFKAKFKIGILISFLKILKCLIKLKLKFLV